MAVSRHLAYMQLILACFEDVLRVPTESMSTDVPVSAQLDVNAMDMVKMKMYFQYHAGWPIVELPFASSMSIKEMSMMACRIEASQFTSAV